MRIKDKDLKETFRVKHEFEVETGTVFTDFQQLPTMLCDVNVFPSRVVIVRVVSTTPLKDG